VIDQQGKGAIVDATRYEQFRDEIFESMWRELPPMTEEIEDTEEIDNGKLMPKLSAMGALALTIPEEYGGHGLTITQYWPILAELSKIHGGIRALVHVHNSFTHAMAELGNERQKAELLPGCVDGTHSLAWALTEPDRGTGSDVGTTADIDGDDYLINGRKWLITNSDIASHFLVVCKVEGRPSIVIVECDAPGFTIEPLPELMGCKGGQHGLLTFENVRVPRTNLVREEGDGLAVMEEALEISRVLVAASSLGTAERSLELSVEFAKQRETFGRPIAERQAVQRYLAEMAVDVHALRLLMDDCAAKWDAGTRIPAEASICKLFGLEAVGRVTDRAILVHGGIGYTRKHEVERLYRDARLNWFEEGTPTIQQLVIARQVLNGYTSTSVRPDVAQLAAS
jgi:alkylation response protein AidB-like acyl-CoA dehydrogenase